MKDISERVSYLQGLSEGLNVSDGSPQGKIIAGVLGILDDINYEIMSMKSNFEGFREYVKSIDDDLFDLEECLNQDGENNFEYREIACPNCSEKVYFSCEVMDDDDIEIVCPSCNEVVFINDGSFDYEPANIGNQEQIGDKNGEGMESFSPS